MFRQRTVVIALCVAFSTGFSSAWAFVVTDPGVTARNALIAALKNRLLETLTEQHRRLRTMAERLSVHTNLDKYALPEPPKWRTHGSDDFLYTRDVNDALIFGDAAGRAYLSVSRPLTPPRDALGRLTPTARAALLAQLATLNAADATAIAGIDQTGRLRFNGRKRELPAIDALEADVLDPSPAQSATAVLDKLSGAVLIEARQKQARLQFLTAIVEQLLVENKRARDTEAAILNMQLWRLRADLDESGRAFLAGSSDDLRAWRQR